MTKATSEEGKNDKTLSEKKQDSMEADGDIVEADDSGKKKKKKGAKEEAAKEKGNFIIWYYLIDQFL